MFTNEIYRIYWIYKNARYSGESLVQKLEMGGIRCFAEGSFKLSEILQLLELLRLLRLLLLFGLVSAAVRFDLRTGRIPNKLILTGLLAAACTAVFDCAAGVHAESVGGAGGVLAEDVGDAAGAAVEGVWDIAADCALHRGMAFVCGMLLPLAFPGVLFLPGMIGAGDVKLFCVIGAFAGPSAVWTAILWSFASGAVQSVMFLLLRRRREGRDFYFRGFCDLAGYVNQSMAAGKWGNYREHIGDGGKIHFSLSILSGLLICLFTGKL